MRHQAEHIALRRIDAGDVVERAVRIGLGRDLTLGVAIAEGDEALAFEPGERLGIADIVAFAMGDADIDHLPLGIGGGEGGVVALDAQMLALADEFQIGVACKNARQQPGLAGDLEAVADAEHEAAARCMGPRRVHDVGATGNRAAAQIVAIGKAARQHDEVGPGRQLVVAMPDMRDAGAGLLQSLGDVAIAVGARKGDDGGFHRLRLRSRRGSSRSPYWRAASRRRP